MTLKIEKISFYLPEKIVSNSDLSFEKPTWSIEKVEKKTGVINRHIANKDETAYDLSYKACQILLKKDDIPKINGIIYCTQTPDYIMPSNSFLLHKDLNLENDVFCFDFNHACSGYIYSLIFADNFLKTDKFETLLLVNADTYSKHIDKNDRSTSVLFGDASAVTLITKSTDTSRIIDFKLSTYGKGYNNFWIPGGGYRNRESKDNKIIMNGFGVWSFLNSVVPKQISDLLEKNKTNIDDIDHFVFHQASLLTLNSIVKKLKINKDKITFKIENIGNTVSASIPIVLHDAIKNNKIKRGSKIILSGFGVGLSYGSILMEY